MYITTDMTKEEAELSHSVGLFVQGDLSPRGTVSCAEAIDALSTICHARSVRNGWWEKPRNPGELIALVHSEMSEALEGVRKDTQDDHCPEFKSVEVELADALHRIFDFARAGNLRIGAAFEAKCRYNDVRPDHKPENRALPGGKKF